ncbi:hypothetical protein NLU66_06955 [Brachybacterium sp. NBEC-018]|uniref:hypothetical protein n=1 Tax=Brachybacterium sp. NBEC-018 TaxID=2996004 RepID=UPI002174F135|nr:hypothetical protein [Brachybacterium sp. NBEC-018]UVY85323.1 hypothetical protein NLU66_06955 [Brachybacterium sp. NBEC-018]
MTATPAKTTVTRRTLARSVAWIAPTAVVAAAAPALAVSTDCVTVNLAVGSQMTLTWDNQWVESLNSSNFVANSGTLAGSPTTFTPSSGSRCLNGRNVAAATPVTQAKIGQRDPNKNGATFSYDRTLCIAAGTYQIRYYAAAYRGNPITAYMTPSVHSPTGSTLAVTAIPSTTLSQSVTAHGFINPSTGSGTNSNYVQSNLSRTQFGFQFVVPTRGTYTFRFLWSFGAISTDAANAGRLTQNPFQGDACLPTYANDIAVEAPVIRRAA